MSKEIQAPFELRHRCGSFDAYSREDAFRNEFIFPDTVIIRKSDGAWVNRPLCLNRRARLNAIHGLE